VGFIEKLMLENTLQIQKRELQKTCRKEKVFEFLIVIEAKAQTTNLQAQMSYGEQL